MGEEERPEGEDIAERFPAVPARRDLSEVPKVTVNLPPHPHRSPASKPDPGGMQKAALATQAASALVTPVIVLALGGNWLDKKFGTGWIAFVGVILGFIVGMMGLMRILQKMSE